MQLIDAKVLKQDLMMYGLIVFADMDLVTKAMKIVNRQPEIDAVPVMHGTWIDMGDFEQCSVCTATHLKTIQTVYGNVTWIKSDYCPACGARMSDEI